MAEFHIELELTGLKLKIRGSREDVPVAMHHIGQQVTGMLGPIADIVEGEIVEETRQQAQTHQAATALAAPARKRAPRKKRSASTAATSAPAADEAILFRHDPAKWGYPLQDWKGWQKAMWLMYVVSQETEHKELTAGVIVQTFNTHFQTAGTIAHIQVNRDLAAKKSKPHMFVGTNTTQEPEGWFLLDKGIKYAQSLVAEALGDEQPAAASE